MPGQMASNDLNHGLTVEDQVGRLAAIVDQVALQDVVGVQVTQPVSLGSAGEPPFVAPDGATIGPESYGASEGLSFTVGGPSSYNPPSGAPVGGIVAGGITCGTPTATTYSETGACTLVWNFTGNSQAFSFGDTGSGTEAVNVTTNSSTIATTGTGSGGNYLRIMGSSNTITMSGVGSGKTTIVIVGNSNTLTVNTVGSSAIAVYIYGNHDSLTVGSVGSGPVKVVVYGSQDTFSVPSDTGSQVFNLYFNGFNATAPTSSLCPYQNLSSTDSVTGFTEVGSGSLTEYLNNSVHYYANSTGPACTGNPTCWTTHSQNVAQTTCPFFSPISVPYARSGIAGASFVVLLRNSYAPPVDIAYDAGAVVYAEAGGVPVMVDSPPITYAHGALTIVVPQFSNPIASVAGTSTTVLNLGVTSVESIALPEAGFNLSGSVTVKLTTPFAAAWMSYFSTVPAFSGLATCAGTSAACNGPFSFSGGLGTVTLVVPAKTLTLAVATFSVSIV